VTFPPQQYPPQPGYPQQPQGYPQTPQQPTGPYGQAPQPQVPQQPLATQSVDEFFARSGGGAPSFYFDQPGAQVVGTITDMQVRQQTQIGTNAPLFFDDGTPRMQLEITLQTQLSGWQGVKPDKIPTQNVNGQDVPKPPSEDDGKRRIYVRYKLKDAVDKALAAANKKAPAVGDQLAVRWSGQEPNPMGGNAIKLYEAVLRPGAPAADAFFAGSQQQAAPAPQQPAYDPRQAYAQPTGQQQQFQQPQAPAQAPQPGPAQPNPAAQQPAPQQPGSPWGAGEPPF
jgi:hypothetical protein